jgi:hypothetical protein
MKDNSLLENTADTPAGRLVLSEKDDTAVIRSEFFRSRIPFLAKNIQVS